VGYSKIYLGSDIAHENDIVRAIGKDVSSLHVGAQRIAWALLMGERVGVDIDSEVKKLVSQHGDEPMAHVTIAMARTGQGRKDEAAKHLEMARERLREDHPWRELVDAAQQLGKFEREPQLVEEVPGRIYRVIAVKSAPRITSANVNVATFLRVKSGDLVCINPVVMNDALVARIRELGDVTHVIAPAKYHNENVLEALAAFPGAKAWGVPAHAGYEAVKDIPFTGLLSDDAPLFPGEIDQITMQGFDPGDVWLLDRASSTVIVTDAILMSPPSDEYRTPFGLFYRWAWGLHERDVGFPSYQPPMWKNLPDFQASFRRALEHDFTDVASSHGSFRAVSKAELSSALDWFLDLKRVDGLRLVADFAWRHPKMTYRFLKEQIAAARAKRANAS
jgi:hypothetical protein